VQGANFSELFTAVSYEFL